MLTRPHHDLMRRLMLYALCRSFSCTRHNGVRSTTSICMKNCCHASKVDRRQNSFASSAGLMVFCSAAPSEQRWAVLMATEAAHISTECPRSGDLDIPFQNSYLCFLLWHHGPCCITKRFLYVSVKRLSQNPVNIPETWIQYATRFLPIFMGFKSLIKENLPY